VTHTDGSFSPSAATYGRLHLDLSGVSSGADVSAFTSEDGLRLVWPTASQGRYAITFALDPKQALIREISSQQDGESSRTVLARDLRPHYAITVGSRDLSTPAGWTIFFDSPHRRPHVRHTAVFEPVSARVRANGSRATVSFDGLTAGPFAGQLEVTVFAGSPLVQVDAVVQTHQDAVAFVYDAGLVAPSGAVRQFVFVDPTSCQLTSITDVGDGLEPVSARFRSIVAETAEGASLAVFPPPHQFFYPLDFADNFGFNLIARVDGRDEAYLWGIHQPPEGDRRNVPWGQVPWVNGPPDTVQRLSLFFLPLKSEASAALESVKAFTHGDSYVHLQGHVTFTSHFHIEHTLSLMGEMGGCPPPTEAAETQPPAFVRAMRANGVNIVHLAEFHKQETPILGKGDRLARLELLHRECRRWSDEGFLVVPGEEPNVHLGGHWISLFPRPVYWVLNRRDDQPLMETLSDGRTLYRVGSPADVLAVMELENGRLWTAHPRIKSSVAEPDSYRDTPVFLSDRFVGAAWKAMPADYSKDRLGTRVLDLYDDMLSWETDKHVLGETDVFKVEPSYELYGHMNINYLRLDRVPSFDSGWGAVGDALARGDFFVTTGEVLILDLTAITRSEPGAPLIVEVLLDWTFPLAFAEIICGYGARPRHIRFDLSGTRPFGRERFTFEVPGEGLKWWRLEVWDVARDGAFSQHARV
jgi:hypothetical protein